jgi:hypothetical protein
MMSRWRRSAVVVAGVGVRHPGTFARKIELSLCTKREEECAERNVYSRPHLVKWTPARYG